MISDTNEINAQCRLPERFYSKDDLDKMFQNKKIYIYGAGNDGRGVFHALKRNGLKVEAFLDRSIILTGGGGYSNVPILPPDAVINGDIHFADSAFIVLALTKEKKKVLSRLNSAGFTEGKNLIQRTDLCPVSPSIEISGFCNLRCLACPRSDTLQPFEKGGFMSLSDYEKVVAKLLKEIPMLHMISLFIWSDPLLHPNLPEIIKMNSNLGLGSFLSTNLNIKTEKLDNIIKANPPYLKITCSGFGRKNYEMNQAGADWDIFYRNIFEVSRLIKKYNASTAVEIFFLITKENVMEYKEVAGLAREQGFRLQAGLSMLFPKYAMDFIEGSPLHEGAQKAKALMCKSLEEMLSGAKLEHEKLCPMRIGFPNINWDMSVLSCCNFNQDRLCDNFFDTDVNELIKLKDRSPLCKKCISYSLHRYGNVQSNIEYVQNLLLSTNNLPSYI